MIFYGLLKSNLPESGKSLARLAEQAYVLVTTGSDTTANTLTVVTYELLVNPYILQKLRVELQDATPKINLPVLS